MNKFKAVEVSDKSTSRVLRVALERDFESVIVYGFEAPPSNKVEIIYSSSKSRAERMCALWDVLNTLGQD